MGVPRKHAEANAKNRHGSNLNFSVAQAKHAVSRIDPGRDASRENADRARATWRDGASDRKQG
jgi:hypothetical protein